MDITVLRRAMEPTYASDETLVAYLPHFENAMRAAGITNVRRAAAWCAQIGHESVGLRYMEEIADGSAYNGRSDLGNVFPGDGPRFKGRGPIQLTGRSNYAAFGAWCKSQGYIDDANLFVNQPEIVARPQWGFLAASWYWVVARPQINSYADAGNFDAVTRAINGGYHGKPDRDARYQRCLSIGEALLPQGDILAVATDGEKSEILKGIRQFSGQSKNVRKPSESLVVYLPPSFKDPEGVWVRDEIDALVNEVVWDGIDLTGPVKGYKAIDVPDTTGLNHTERLVVIAARQQAIRSQLNRIEEKLDKLLAK